MSTYAGIDYGRGLSNVDSSNGIRYGVISQHSVTQAWAESAEPDYGSPTCPQCGNDAIEIPSHAEPDPTGEGKYVSIVQDVPEAYEDYEQSEYDCIDYACESCEYLFGSESAYGEEPIAWNYEGDGYVLTDCLDSDIMVLKSPYFTYAQFCSPCVPGAGNLNSPMPVGVGAKSYCLASDWFDDEEPCPYPYWSVKTGELVYSPPAEEEQEESAND